MAKKGSQLLLWIIVISLLITVATGISVSLILGAGTPIMSESSAWLHLRITPTIEESPGSEGLMVDALDMPPLSTEVSAAILHAADDPEIEGLFVEIGSLGVGWAQADEMRAAMLAFSEVGKPCVAWAHTLTNREYFLATGCEEIHLAPAGLTLVNGLAMTQTYYAGTFERFGVSSNFAHVGDFKSAIEPYERSGPSEAASEATNAILDSLYSRIVAAIAEGRGLDDDAALALIDDPPITPKDALERGMIDALSFRDQVEDDVIDADLLEFSDYLRDLRMEWRNGGPTVAVIYAVGTIVSGSSNPGMFGGNYIGDRTLRKQLEQVREDEDVAAVVLRVNSPGGSGNASDAIWREVALTREVKPVVVSMSDYAASGGYYISMGADHIVAEPTTLTGSIGVFGGKLNLAGVYESLGVTLHTYQRGEYAQLLSSTSDWGEAERAKFQRFLGSFYDLFLERAAEGRQMSTEQVHAVAQGRVWTGTQALELGLIDSLGGLDDAVAIAVDKAGIEGEPSLLRIPERRGFIEQLLEEMSNPDAADVRALMPVGEAPRMWADLVALERVLSDGQVAALLPGRLDLR